MLVEDAHRTASRKLEMLLDTLRRAESPGYELEDDHNLNTFTVGRDVRQRTTLRQCWYWVIGMIPGKRQVRDEPLMMSPQGLITSETWPGHRRQRL